MRLERRTTQFNGLARPFRSLRPAHRIRDVQRATPMRRPVQGPCPGSRPRHTPLRSRPIGSVRITFPAHVIDHACVYFHQTFEYTVQFIHGLDSITIG